MLHAFNTKTSTKQRISTSALKSKCSAFCAAFRHRNDRLNATGREPIENWTYHDAMENATSEVPTVIPRTVYSSLPGETIDIRGEAVSARRGRTVEDNGAEEGVTRGAASRSRGVNRTIEHLVTSIKEIEARCFKRGDPDRRTFSRNLAPSTTFFGQPLKSMDKQDQVQSGIAVLLQASLDIEHQMLMVMKGDFGSSNNNATSYNAFENSDYNYTNHTSCQELAGC